MCFIFNKYINILLKIKMDKNTFKKEIMLINNNLNISKFKIIDLLDVYDNINCISDYNKIKHGTHVICLINKNKNYVIKICMKIAILNMMLIHF